ncbi:MAG: mechanosensitive ion channel family protein [Pseudomonadota bacterium]
MRVILILVLASGWPLAGLAQSEPTAIGEEAVVISDAPSESFLEDGVSSAELQLQLQSLYAEIEGLDEVNMTVTNGVVTLSGIVPDEKRRDTAVIIANRFSGVAAVDNNIELDRRLANRLRAGVARVKDGAFELAVILPSLIVALLAVVLFWWFGHMISRRDKVIRRIAPNAFLQALLQQVLKTLFIVGGVTSALFIMNAGGLLGSIAGALGIVGLAIGFATRDTVENFIASILLSLRQPFRAKDHVQIGEYEGKVMRLSSRATILMSLDGNHIRIPNSVVFKSTIVNFSRNPRRRFSFDVGVDTEIPLNEPVDLALSTMRELEGVLDDPEPLCMIKALGDSSVILTILAWVDQREASFGGVRSLALRSVKEAFDQAGVVMPEPIYNVNIRIPSANLQTSPVKKPVSRPSALAVQASPEAAIDQQMANDVGIDGEENLLSENATAE